MNVPSMIVDVGSITVESVSTIVDLRSTIVEGNLTIMIVPSMTVEKLATIVDVRSTIIDGKFTNVPESATVVAHSVSPLKNIFSLLTRSLS